VLDIGVGRGRTTVALSETVGKYVGIDYSAKMIAACKERFRSTSQPLSFYVCDVRDMHRFPNHTFDVVMFSFNGLDYMLHEDRLIALRETRSVCVRNGWFVFSTHNKGRPYAVQVSSPPSCSSRNHEEPTPKSAQPKISLAS
jgi:ubiquinone/menaquinone biosynthesis C-methylase UbiE